ncbi:MAG: hypothetical protein D6736_03540 [Nitrospinota bacterium]|nr:MAG: hypothetical protein D6736_03540 [Nitrospinota bacterium]
MAQPTYDDANLILRLYELRREEKMRKARHWFLFEFKPGSWEEIKDIYFTGEETDNYIRMVTSYWNMVSVFVRQGILNKELFFATNGENIVVWRKTEPWIGGARKQFNRPTYLGDLEAVAKEHLEWRSKQS